MRRTGISKPTDWRWWDRYLAEGVDGLLYDATRPPGRTPVPEDRVRAAIELAMSPPQPHAGHWTRKPWPSPWATWFSPRFATSCAATACGRSR